MRRLPVTKNPTKWSSLAALLVALSFNTMADEYADARAEMVTAYQAQDYEVMVVAAEKSLKARPEYPGALFNLALAQALSGESVGSLATLERLLAKGIDFNAYNLDEFAAVRELPAWIEYIARIEALHEPVGNAAVALQFDDGQFVPEGIAIDADGNYFLGSIHRGQLLRVGGYHGIAQREGRALERIWYALR